LPALRDQGTCRRGCRRSQYPPRNGDGFVHPRLADREAGGYRPGMNTLADLEREIEKLAPEEFIRLSEWMAQRQASLWPASTDAPRGVFRDHRAFLNSYAPEDDGLYDDAASR
jgi:hypothetical protein